MNCIALMTLPCLRFCPHFCWLLLHTFEFPSHIHPYPSILTWLRHQPAPSTFSASQLPSIFTCTFDLPIPHFASRLLTQRSAIYQSSNNWRVGRFRVVLVLCSLCPRTSKASINVGLGEYNWGRAINPPKCPESISRCDGLGHSAEAGER